MKIPTGKDNEYNDRIERASALDTAAGYADEVLHQLEDGHLFSSAAWKLIHKKTEMGDMDWMREVGKEAIRMAHEETFLHNAKGDSQSPAR